MKLQEYFLLPGPTNVPNNVLRAMAAPMINHRGPEFKTILEEVTEQTKEVFKTKGNVFTLTTSGTGGLEAAVVNFINPGDKVIVASIGNFGERFRNIAQEYDADVEFIDFGWGNALDPQVIAQRLAADKNQEIKAVLCQHNETSTAIVNPIKELGAVMKDHPALLIVDTVSGLGAAPFAMDDWGVDVAIAGSQKAFMSPPGLAFVAVNDRAMAVARETKNRKFYFDLLAAEDMLKKGQTPYTPAISVIYAVHEALKYFKEVGVDAIVADHYRNRDLVRVGVQAMGLNTPVPPEIASPAVTLVECPEGIDPGALRSLMLSKYNVVIAGGQGKFAGNTFRIGHLGAVQAMDLIAVMASLELALHELGAKVEIGSGVKAMEYALLGK